jgi:hypothetical protein
MDEELQLKSVEDLSDEALVKEIKDRITSLNYVASVCLSRQITLVYGIGSDTAQFDETIVVPKLTLKAAAKQLLKQTILVPRR